MYALSQTCKLQGISQCFHDIKQEKRKKFGARPLISESCFVKMKRY